MRLSSFVISLKPCHYLALVGHFSENGFFCHVFVIFVISLQPCDCFAILLPALCRTGRKGKETKGKETKGKEAKEGKECLQEERHGKKKMQKNL